MVRFFKRPQLKRTLPSVKDDLDARAEQIIHGQKTSEPNRANTAQANRPPAIKPDYESAQADDASMVVQISPNSPPLAVTESSSSSTVQIEDTTGNPLDSNGAGALKIDGSAVVQPVSGIVAVTGPIKIEDSTGAALDSNGSGALKVDGTATTQPVSEATLDSTIGTPGGSVPAKAILIGFQDGGAFEEAGTSNPLPVSVLTIPTVTVEQATGANLHTDVDNFPASQPVTEVSLDATIQATGSAVPVKSIQVAGSDGTDIRTLATDSGGQLKVLVEGGSGVTDTVNQGTANTLANGWPVKVTDGTHTLPTMDAAARAAFVEVTDGTNILGTPTNPLRIDPTGGTVQPVNVTKIGGINIVENSGEQVVQIGDSIRATYNAAFAGTTLASGVTFTITGSGTKTIKIWKVQVNVYGNSSVAVQVLLDKYSSAATGGTPATITAAPYDSGDAAATALSQSWSVKPSGGLALVAHVDVIELISAGISTVLQSGDATTVWTYGDDNSRKPLTLKGTAQVFGVVFNVALSANIIVEFTEE